MDLSSITDFLKNFSATVVAIVAMGGHAIILWRKLKPYTTITEDIIKIRQELTSNGGKSLKDCVKKVHEEVKENTELTKTIMCRQRWIMDSRSEPVFEADENGSFTWVNEAFIRFTKRAGLDLLGNKWKNIVAESYRDSVFQHWDSAIQEKRNFEETICIIDKKGKKFLVSCIAAIQQDGKYIGSFSDIREYQDPN